MPELFSAEWFLSLLIVVLVQAFPSAAFGIVLARRVDRPFWHGLLAGFFLPWIGLAFIPRRPLGERYTTGFAHYAVVMLFVAFIMTFASVFQEWAEVSGSDEEYTPARALPVAILVCLVAIVFLVGSLGLLFQGGMPTALTVAIIVSLLFGWYLALQYLYGAGALFAGQVPDDMEVEAGPGAWLALVALITGYVSLIVAPFGLKARPIQPPQPPQPQPAPLAPQAPGWQQPAPQQWGSSRPAQGWDNPPRKGATW